MLAPLPKTTLPPPKNERSFGNDNRFAPVGRIGLRSRCWPAVDEVVLRELVVRRMDSSTRIRLTAQKVAAEACGLAMLPGGQRFQRASYAKWQYTSKTPEV
jgi:hypothetical protein